MDREWANFYHYLLRNNPQKAESLLNIYHFQNSLPHTLNIERVLNDGSEYTKHMHEKVVAAQNIIQYIRKQHWYGIITTDLQRASTADSEYDLHFQMINFNYLRHWIILSIKFDSRKGSIYLDTKVFDFDNISQYKRRYNIIYETNTVAFLNKLKDWLIPYTIIQGENVDSTIHSIAENELQAPIGSIERDQLASPSPKKSRHFYDIS